MRHIIRIIIITITRLLINCIENRISDCIKQAAADTKTRVVTIDQKQEQQEKSKEDEVSEKSVYIRNVCHLLVSISLSTFPFSLLFPFFVLPLHIL